MFLRYTLAVSLLARDGTEGWGYPSFMVMSRMGHNQESHIRQIHNLFFSLFSEAATERNKNYVFHSHFLRSFVPDP